MNKVFLGDCADTLKDIAENSIDLIYMDPPFFTGKVHKQKNKDRTKEFKFNDLWSSHEQYAEYLMQRIKLMHHCLKETGSIFIHCDDDADHIIRFIMDDVFGKANFRSKIIWHYKRWSNAKKGLLPAHQYIYFYSKTESFKFNKIFNQYSHTTNIDQILQKRKRDSDNKSAYALDDEGNTIIGKVKQGVPLSDVWDIPYLNPKAKERVGYPTQKPLLLLEQIIKLTTDENDLVLDPFCGSGTTCIAAKLANRRYIGIDQSEQAVQLTNERLNNPIKTESQLLINGKESYVKKDIEILNVLHGAKFNIVHRNKSIDAILSQGNNDDDGQILVKIQKENESIDEAAQLLSNAMKIKKSAKSILIQTKKETPSLSLVGIFIIKSPALQISELF